MSTQDQQQSGDSSLPHQNGSQRFNSDVSGYIKLEYVQNIETESAQEDDIVIGEVLPHVKGFN